MFQPYGNLVAASGADGTTRIYDPRMTNLVSSIKQINACKSVFDLTGQYIACGDMDGNLIVQDMRTSRPLF